jgi:Methyltransferase FkbM domain
LKRSKLHSALKKSFLFPYFLAIRELSRSFRKVDFTQFGEQEIIRQLIPQESGTFLDIGAGRPISGNNTFFLYKKGWSGILVDPIRANCISSRLVRRRDLCINAIVGKTESTRFFEFFPYEYSTTSTQVAGKVPKEFDYVELISEYEIEGLSAASLFMKLPKNTFVFLNIDTEGSDYDVLESLDLRVNQPNLICIEEWDFESGSTTKVNELLFQHGYKLMARAGLSTFYMK